MVSKPRQGEVRPQLQGAHRAVPWTGSPSASPKSPQFCRINRIHRRHVSERVQHQERPGSSTEDTEPPQQGSFESESCCRLVLWVIVLVLTACCMLWCKDLITLTFSSHLVGAVAVYKVLSATGPLGPVTGQHSPNPAAAPARSTSSCPRTSEPR